MYLILQAVESSWEPNQWLLSLEHMYYHSIHPHYLAMVILLSITLNLVSDSDKWREKGDT